MSSKSHAQCTNTPTVEAVRNGNFEAGYLTKSGNGHTYTANGPFDFQSDLTSTSNFAANPPVGTCLTSIPNDYAVGRAEPGMTCTAQPRQAFAGTDYIDVDFNDHTPGLNGNGFALIGDFENYTGGKYDSDPAGLPAIWRQHITIYPNQKYYFSAWFANYNRDANQAGYINSTLNFIVIPMISGVLQYSARANVGTAVPTGKMNWQQFYGTWTPSASYTEAMILIEVQAPTATFRNDLLIDDISFINGCNNLTSLPASTTPALGSDFSLCTTNGAATLNSNVSTGGTTQFWWYSGTGSAQTTLVSASSTANTYAITTPGTYRVCVQTSSFPTGCSASSTIVVTATMPAVTVADAVLCTATTTTLSASLTGTGLTYDWYKKPSGAPTSTSSTITTGVVGTYGVKVTPSAAAQAAGCVMVTSNDAQLTSNISSPSIVSSNCAAAPNGSFSVTGTGGGNTFTWYDAATGGNVVATGNPATIPITGPSTVYVENSNTYSAAPLRTDATSDDGGGGSSWNSTHFTALQDFTLVSLWLQSAFGSSPVSLSITKDGSAYATAGPFSLSQGVWKQVSVNWPIVAGSSYVITYTTSDRLALKSSFSSTTYNSMVRLDPNVNGTSGAAIEWTIRTGSPCLRGSVSLSCPLPISLLSFDAKATSGNEVAITWQTSAEVNNNYFVLEKSSDGKTFTPLANIKGKGNSSTLSFYSYEDLTIGEGTIYYRLKQVDFNGDYTYSEIKTITPANDHGIHIYPNPNQGNFTISALEGGTYKITIVDLVGQIVYQLDVYAVAALEKNIQTSLTKGTYFVQVVSNEKQTTDKLIIE
ncbi:MAG TPA: T9SS type A sorting domain-containing protein [Cytophagaceae bacterium]|nr:T9SS type A sorting domain-containing protein [Cytophagaceae bacterium]